MVFSLDIQDGRVVDVCGGRAAGRLLIYLGTSGSMRCGMRYEVVLSSCPGNYTSTLLTVDCPIDSDRQSVFPMKIQIQPGNHPALYFAISTLPIPTSQVSSHNHDPCHVRRFEGKSNPSKGAAPPAAQAAHAATKQHRTVRSPARQGGAQGGAWHWLFGERKHVNQGWSGSLAASRQ